jgi:molybdate transport system permease protein
MGSCCPARHRDRLDWSALALSIKLGALTVLILLPLGILLGRWLAFHRFRGRSVVEAALALPLVLPPTVIGYYLLVTFGGNSPLGPKLAENLRASTGFQFRRFACGVVADQCPVRSAADAAGF